MNEGMIESNRLDCLKISQQNIELLPLPSSFHTSIQNVLLFYCRRVWRENKVIEKEEEKGEGKANQRLINLPQ